MSLNTALKESLFKDDIAILSNVSLEGYGTIDKYFSDWLYRVKTLFTDTLFSDRLALIQNKPTNVRYVTDLLKKKGNFSDLSAVQIDIPKNLDVTMDFYAKVVLTQLTVYVNMGTNIFNDLTEYVSSVVNDPQQGSTLYIPHQTLPDVASLRKSMAACFDPRKQQMQVGPAGTFYHSQKGMEDAYAQITQCFDQGTQLDLKRLKDGETALITALDKYRELISNGTVPKTKEGTGSVIAALETLRDVQEYLAVLFERANSLIALWNMQMESLRKELDSK